MPLFYGLAALALAIFGWGVIGRIRFWLSGSARASQGNARLNDAPALVRRGIGALSRPQFLQALFWNGLVLRQLWRESRQRWLMHLTISWSFVGLFAVGSLGNMAADFGAPLEKDDAWFAAFNDGLSLALLAGLALALGRRYLEPRPYVRTIFEDASVLAVLGLLVLGGLLLEAARYLEEGTASVGGYAFLGHPLSRAAEPLGWDWVLVHDWLWWTHAVLALGLVAYLPYSKLLHMFTSPLTIALSAGDDHSPVEPGGAVEAEAEAWTA